MPSTGDPSLTPVQLAVWRGMLVVHARTLQTLDAEMRAAHGIPVSAYEVLILLVDAPGHRLRMSESADGALLSRSGCTRLVDRLVRQGHVARVAVADDGRGTFAQLTPSGTRLARAARVTHLAGVRRLFLDRLAPGEQRTLGEIWTRLSSPAHGGSMVDGCAVVSDDADRVG